MKKILVLFTVLCMTLMFTGCTKTVKLEDIDSANFTEDILSIKCTNTLEEMMSEDFEPKFEVSNNYKEGDIPYLNFDFDKKDDLNNFFLRQSLSLHANHTANDVNIENEYEDGYYNKISLTYDSYVYNDNYLFIIFSEGRYRTSYRYSFCIDLDNKKLLTKEEILALKNYDVIKNKDNILDQILNNFSYEDERDREKLFNILLNDLKIYDRYSKNNEVELKEYGKIGNMELVYKYGDSEILTENIGIHIYPYDQISTDYFINEDGELILYVKCNEIDLQYGIKIKLCD